MPGNPLELRVLCRARGRLDSAMGLFSWGKKEPQAIEPVRSVADALKLVLAYHQASKHDYYRFAAGPMDLDWETQPDPFRRYAGALLVSLERPIPQGEPWYEPAFCPGALTARPFDRASVSQLLFDSLALSAWKRSGATRWALRVNPSSGNLHPTEGTLVCGPIPGLFERPTIAHYAPREHALEVRAEFSLEAWRELSAGLPEGSLFVGLSSIHWREAWKYGERAFRYCQHDAGHAIGAVAIAAAALGWRARLEEQISTDDLARLLGVWKNVGVELEEAECLIAITPPPQGESWRAPTAGFFAGCERWNWMGMPNELSPDHAEWPVIAALAEATRKPATEIGAARVEREESQAKSVYEPISLRAIIHQRRSAVSLDGNQRQ
jgi:nitroreductase